MTIDQSRLLPQIRALIVELRNGRDVDTNWPKFDLAVRENLAAIVQSFSMRWLKSICDTYVDFGEPLTARHAMTIVYFVNMLRLAETVKFVRPAVDAERLAQAGAERIKLYDGLSTFNIQAQDVFLNMTRRFHKLIEADAVMQPIWAEVLRRLSEGQNAITDFSTISAVGARYFPVDAAGLTDNHGL
jgi:hypothetical protein